MPPNNESRPSGTASGAAGRPRTGERTDRARLHDALTMAGGWSWPVLPCIAGGKRPATPHGFKDATTDPDRVLGWLDTDPELNIAVATGSASGLVVLDLDPADDAGESGTATFHRLCEELGRPDRPTMVRTPRGGWHLYYAHPGGRIPSTAGKLGPGLDVRADGGYIVVPPSVVDGRPYTWVEEPWPGPPHLLQLPAAWVERLTATEPEPASIPTVVPVSLSGRVLAYVTAAIRGELEEVANAPEGTRNATLNTSAYRVGRIAAASGLDPDAARRALVAVATANGLSPREARRTVESGIRAGLQRPANLPSEVAA